MGRVKSSSRDGERCKLLRLKNRKVQKTQQRHANKISLLNGLLMFLTSDSYMYGPLMAKQFGESGDGNGASLVDGKASVLTGLDVDEQAWENEGRSFLSVRTHSEKHWMKKNDVGLRKKLLKTL